MRLGVGVKCATITPNAQRMERIPPEANVEQPQRHHPRDDWTARCSARPFWSRAYPPSCAPGKARSPSPATPMAMCTAQQRNAHSRPGQVRSWYSPARTARERPCRLSSTSRAAAWRSGHAQSGCVHRQLCARLLPAMRWTLSRICGSPLRTPSPRPTTTASRIFSRNIFDAEYKAAFEAAGIELFLYPDRRRGCARCTLQGRLHLGLQRTTTAT